MSTFKTINLLELEPGMRVTLADGSTAEVVDNPRDGMWVICRRVAGADAGALPDAVEHPVFAQDIVGLVR